MYFEENYIGKVLYIFFIDRYINKKINIEEFYYVWVQDIGYVKYIVNFSW